MMKNKFLIPLLMTLAFYCSQGITLADEPGEKGKKNDADNEVKDQLVETHHTVTINGGELNYTATAGMLVLKKEDGKPRASIFHVAYHKNDGDKIGNRPISFAFNGGPGSSSVWLHLGILGPKRVKMYDNGFAPPPPNELIPNEYSLLDVTDLVFIDPVSTGYSRPAPGEDAKQFYGYENDLETVGEFIRLYLTRNQRWASPKYLIGESYGTTRAVGLANHLMNRYGMYLNGLVLVAPILNFQTINFYQGNDLPYLLFLPAYTATAWYHKMLAPEMGNDLGSILEQVEAFALREYNLALIQGTRLAEPERRAIIKKLAGFTGLSEEFINQSDMRVMMNRFAKELLRNQENTIGRFDSRMLGKDRDAAGESFEYDPSYSMVLGPVTSTLNHYLRTELEFNSDLPYEILTSAVHPWRYNDFNHRYVDVSDKLRQAMVKNPALRVFAACGIYDLATPYFTANYTFDHLGLDKSLQKNIRIDYYQAGHMMYFHLPSLIKLKQDMSSFLANDTHE